MNEEKKDSLNAINKIKVVRDFYNRINIKKYIVGNSIIRLPKNMTIGIEIESEGKNSNLISKIIKNLKGDWKEEIDTSLISGIEVKSPIIYGNDQKRIYEMQEICLLHNKLGQKISERCGGHIHIGSNYLTTKESWMNLLQLWSNNEELLYIIANKEGEAPRFMLSTYAKPYSGALEKALNEKSVKLDTIEDVKKFAKDVQNGTGNFGINFNNLGNEKNTIEFRISNGTTDAKTWIENINLFGGIIKASEDLAMIQKKLPEERTDEEKIKIELFERLNKDTLDDLERLEILLQIIIPKEDRDIYRKRYRVNSKLYEKALVRDFIKTKLAKNKINFMSKATNLNNYNNGVNDNQKYIRKSRYSNDASDREEK